MNDTAPNFSAIARTLVSAWEDFTVSIVAHEAPQQREEQRRRLEDAILVALLVASPKSEGT